MKRRILLVDDEVAVLLTMKAVLEITGFDVDTAASAREGRSRLRTHQYHMVITDMRMENDQAGREVIQAARTAPYHPAVALLTAFPVDEADWQGFGADQLLLKPMHTRVLLDQIEKLFASHEKKLAALGESSTAGVSEGVPAALPAKEGKSKASTKAGTKAGMKAAAGAKRSTAARPATKTKTKTATKATKAARKAAPRAGTKVAKSSAGRAAR